MSLMTVIAVLGVGGGFPVLAAPGDDPIPSDGVGHDQPLPEPVQPDTTNPAPTTPEIDLTPEGTRRVDLTDLNAIRPDNPLYNLVTEIRTLRLRVSLAIDRAEKAEARAQRADDYLADAEFDYTVAAMRAEHAQRIVNRWAAGMYRNEAVGSDTLEAINTSLDDPALMLDIRVWFAGIGNDRRQAVEQAQEALEQATLRRDEADRRARDAAQARRSAIYERGHATRQLETAKSTLHRFIGQTVSDQLLIGPDGCPTSAPENTLRKSAEELDVAELCARSVAQAATPEAALAIKYAFRALGADYACEGIGRWEPFRYDCSSLVMRAYKEGAGLNMTSVGYIPSTRNLVPWNGVTLAPWADEVAPEDARPGDLILYDAGRPDSRHVVMLLADGLMLHVGACNDVVHITDFWGYVETSDYVYLVSRRINPDKARYPGQENLDESGGALDDTVTNDDPRNETPVNEDSPAGISTGDDTTDPAK